MGQPIYLERDGEKMTVYGLAQAKVMASQGWKPVDEAAAIATEGVDDLTAIKGVGEATAQVLQAAGYQTYTALAEAEVDELVALDKITARTAKTIKANAAELAAEMS